MNVPLAHIATHCRLTAQRLISQNVVRKHTIRRTGGRLDQQNTINCTVGFVRGAKTKTTRPVDDVAKQPNDGKEEKGQPSKPGKTKKKKVLKKKKIDSAQLAETPTEDSVELDGDDAGNSKSIVQALKTHLESQWNGDDWGTDELAPKKHNEVENCQRDVGPSYATYPSYTKRIEGTIGPAKIFNVLTDLENPLGPTSIANLAHGLDRVLFNPGVHWMQDPRSRVYNFSPYLQTIPDVKDFAFEKVQTFVKSSRDDSLYRLAAANKRKFGGSTSSLTGILSHIYFLISGDKPVDTSSLSKHFATSSTNFTPAQRMPVSLTLQHRDGIHLFDSDNTDDENTDLHILLFQGTMLESFLTTPKSSFDHLLRSSGKLSPELSEINHAYRYSMSDDFVMRSQLDCHDRRLPGTGVFDIKTRAAISIRLDSLNYKEGSGYLLRTLQGPLESFEREYYDMIRSAFLKYSFQARIGNMDGIFVAYHNTARIFGFQYIPLTEMDARLFGGENRGDRVFEKCVGLLEAVAREISSCYPNQSMSCMVETVENEGVMHVWIQPTDATFRDHIIQLDVTTQSFVNGHLAKGSDAINAAHKPWLLLWSIAHSSLPQEVLRESFERAKRRKAQVYCIPSGVEAKDVGKLATSADFGFSYTPPDLAAAEVLERERRMLSEAMFQPATGIILKLRSLAQAGQMDIERWREEELKHGVEVLAQPPSVDGDGDGNSII
ncbi:Pet127-domain-containing protein [Schizopora paradoxa]|uniref:Pet127-domain-containing protein n=1 Tax=Schizopora paradoxa TaxID=27342 RepID=A0A0H2RXD7_9AGAM|nr:Pet127-domain-containing protein [Schizopora paradoxa]